MLHRDFITARYKMQFVCPKRKQMRLAAIPFPPFTIMIYLPNNHHIIHRRRQRRRATIYYPHPLTRLIRIPVSVFLTQSLSNWVH